MAEQQPGVWGIDIGQCGLKAIRLEEVDGQITATAFDYVEHPKILSQPDADPDALTREALEKFLSRNSLKGDVIAISVPGQSGLARFVKLPPVEEKKIPDIVRFEAKQQIPFPLDEVVWDYQKIGAGMVTDGFAMETEIGLFALKRDMVNRSLQHFKDVNVEVHIVQMAPLALCNFVAYDLLHQGGPAPKTDGEATEAAEPESGGSGACVVALDIGTDNSNLVVTDGNRIIWQRPIPFGGNHFTRALTKDLKLTFAKAEHLKRNATKSPDLKKILAALKPVLNDFVGEVQRSLGYFTNTHRGAQIEYMVGLGNAFRLPGLQKFLSEKLQLEVRRLQKFERVTGESVVTAPTFTQNVMTFATAYGLAQQGMKLSRLQTNLLPPEIQFERMIRAKKPWAVTAAAALLVGVLATTFHYSLQYRAVAASSVEDALKEGDQVTKDAQKKKADYDGKFKQVQDKEDDVRNIVAGREERLDWVMLNKFINDCMPVPGRMVEGKFKSETPGGKEFVVVDTDGKERTFATADTLVAMKGAPVESLSSLKKDQEVQVIYNPDLSEKSKEYGTPAARLAFLKYWQRQAGGRTGDVRAEDEGAIYLIQANVDSVIPRYTSDLKVLITKMKESQNNNTRMLLGMLEKDQKEPPDGAGWIIELRGFTYHDGRSKFLINTLVNNLATRGRKEAAAPGKEAPKSTGAAPPNTTTAATTPAVSPPPPDKKAPDTAAAKPGETPKSVEKDEREEFWSKVILGNISHAVLYDYNTPLPNNADKMHVFSSVVDGLVVSGGASAAAPATGQSFGSKGGDSGGGRSWTPLTATTGGGPTSGGASGGGAPPPGGTSGMGGGLKISVRQFQSMRSGNTSAAAAPPAGSTVVQQTAGSAKALPTSFIVLFVWKEPTPSEARKK